MLQDEINVSRPGSMQTGHMRPGNDESMSGGNGDDRSMLSHTRDIEDVGDRISSVFLLLFVSKDTCAFPGT